MCRRADFQVALLCVRCLQRAVSPHVGSPGGRFLSLPSSHRQHRSLCVQEMTAHVDNLECHCSAYPWRVEASLLLVQGLLSFMHDAYFAGRSPVAKFADRTCATFLTMCQPVKCPSSALRSPKQLRLSFAGHSAVMLALRARSRARIACVHSSTRAARVLHSAALALPRPQPGAF